MTLANLANALYFLFSFTPSSEEASPVQIDGQASTVTEPLGGTNTALHVVNIEIL